MLGSATLSIVYDIYTNIIININPYRPASWPRSLRSTCCIRSDKIWRRLQQTQWKNYSDNIGRLTGRPRLDKTNVKRIPVSKGAITSKIKRASKT